MSNTYEYETVVVDNLLMWHWNVSHMAKARALFPDGVDAYVEGWADRFNRGLEHAWGHADGNTKTRMIKLAVDYYTPKF